MRQLARDPFARTTLVRIIVRPLASGQTCSWCGNVRHSRRGHAPHLYRYGTEPDAIRPRIHWHDGVFCSKSCHDAYHL
jgi:hypothetical protein